MVSVHVLTEPLQSPPHSFTCLPLAGFAVSVTFAPTLCAVTPVGVTVPPEPADAVSVTLKAALAVRGPFIVSVHVSFVPAQLPSQPSKVCAALFALTVTVTFVPVRKVCLPAAGLMLPPPVTDVVSVCVSFSCSTSSEIAVAFGARLPKASVTLTTR